MIHPSEVTSTFAEIDMATHNGRPIEGDLVLDSGSLLGMEGTSPVFVTSLVTGSGIAIGDTVTVRGQVWRFATRLAGEVMARFRVEAV